MRRCALSTETQSRSTFNYPLHRRTRLFLAILAIPVLASYALPIWTVRLKAPQYPDGLRMDVYSYKIEGGNGGQDINEINELNHYIGMRQIDRSQFSDLDWIPFAFGILILLTLRQAALGNLRGLVDLVALTGYVSVFAFARYVYRLYVFGHNLDPHAAVRIAPFMPVVVGEKQLANFTTYGLPAAGSLLLGVFAAGITALAVVEYRRVRGERSLKTA